ncbi:MAG: DUF4470 domain-containing protein [Alphaproteobacteria bacterium]|nr:DUF4470 domain-containing protein [Alphaproteobacteria bacterium]
MAGRWNWQHVVNVARDAILLDNVLALADTSVWFDYFKPMLDATRNENDAKERSYLSELIKSDKLCLTKLAKDELIKTYNRKFRSYMNDGTIPQGAEFNIKLKKKLNGITTVKTDKRYRIFDVNAMYDNIWRHKERYKKELYSWGYSKARDAYGNSIWNDLDDAGKAAFLESGTGPSVDDRNILATAAHLKKTMNRTFVILFARDNDFLAFSHIIYEEFAVLSVRPSDIMPD